eukprot:4745320-Pyramimonas_sp.AAC.1
MKCATKDCATEYYLAKDCPRRQGGGSERKVVVHHRRTLFGCWGQRRSDLAQILRWRRGQFARGGRDLPER